MPKTSGGVGKARPTTAKKAKKLGVTVITSEKTTGTANAITRGKKVGVTSGKAKAYGLTGAHRTTQPAEKGQGRFGGPNSGRPVKAGVGQGKGKGSTYGVGLGGTPPRNRGGTQIKKAVGGTTAKRSAAKKAYKGKNFKAAWAGYKRGRRLPNKTAGKPRV